MYDKPSVECESGDAFADWSPFAAQWVQILDILQEAGLGDDFALRMCEELLLPSGTSGATDERTEDKKARDLAHFLVTSQHITWLRVLTTFSSRNPASK